MTPETLGEYTITRLLGRGGMAEVYEGYDADLQRAVAIKVILPAVSGEPGFEERFRREARLVASLRHPHIVQVYDFDVVDGRPFMVMEYLPGKTLKDRLADLRSRGETMPLAESARILDAVAAALDYAHGRGAIHRDIKPANILFTGDDTPVVADFGIARLLGDVSQLTVSGQIVGSPAYMAPEQARGEAVDGRCDQYALGVTLYEMTTGRPPFQGDSPTSVLLQHVSSTPPPPRSLNPNLPDAVQAVLLTALAKEPAQRFATVGELAAAFRQALAGGAPAPATATSPEAATLLDQALPPAAPGVENEAITPPAATLAGAVAVIPGEVPKADAAPGQPAAAKTPPGEDRFLTGLLKVASIFAPLVGQESKPVAESPPERRGRLAAIMGAVGILLASVQLVAGAFDLASRPAALLGRYLPYVIVVLLVGGALLSLRLFLRASSLRRRRQAGALLVTIVLAGLAWGGFTLYDRLRPPDGFLVLIADFDGTNATRKGDFAGRIGAELTRELAALGDTVTIERSLETYADAESAQAAGRSRKAGMVIWGAYDDFGVTPHVELLRQPSLQPGPSFPQLVLDTLGPATAEAAASTVPSLANDISYLTRAPLATTDLDLFAAHGPDQLTYLVSAILATGLYADGQYADALALFDKALANAEASGTTLGGQAQVTFQRAMVEYALGETGQAAADLEKAAAIAPDLFAAHYNLAVHYASTCSVPDALARAVAEAETAVRLRPDRAEAHRLLGSLYQQAGRTAEAVRSLQTALALDDQDPITYQALAAAYNALGDESAAIQASQQAVALRQAALTAAPDDTFDAQLALGDAFVGAGDYAPAIAAYQAAATLQPTAAAPQRGLGNAYYWQGHLDQSIAAYQRAAALAPQDPAAPLLAGLVQAQQGDIAGAIASQQAAARLATCDPAPYLLLGGLYFQQNDYIRAAGAYESALAVNPGNANAWYVLGSLRRLQDDLTGAAEAAQKAVDLDPNIVEAQRVLATSRFRLGDAAGALPAAQALARLEPQTAANQSLLGDIYLSLQRWDAAVQAYEAALALEDSASTHVLLGMAQLESGQTPAAVEQMQAALTLEPNNHQAWQGLGSAYVQQGKLTEAAAAYEKALSIEESALAHEQLALIDVQLGDTEQAITHYQRAAALDPSQVRFQVRLGGLYASQGRLADAETAFRAALATNPDNADAHAGLANTAYRQCRIDLAVQSMSQAAALAPTYRASLVGFYEAQGRTADADALIAELDAAPAEDVFAHLTVADDHFRRDALDDAARAYQQILEAGHAPAGLVTSLIHNALGQIDVLQERLFAAGGAFEQALAAYPANFDAQVGLGDLALRAGDATQALAAYDAARPMLSQYYAGQPAENASLATVLLDVRRSLALARQGDAAEATAALDQALATAEAAVALTPRAPVAQFALGVAYLARGEVAQAEVAFARASECDQSLVVARSRVEKGLASLRE